MLIGLCDVIGKIVISGLRYSRPSAPNGLFSKFLVFWSASSLEISVFKLSLLLALSEMSSSMEFKLLTNAAVLCLIAV